MKHRVTLAVLAAVIGITVALCLSRHSSRTAAPDGWLRQTRGQPFVSQAVLASAPPSWNTWSLAAYQQFVAKEDSQSLTVHAAIPEGGRMVLSLDNSPQGRASALVIEAGERPTGVMTEPSGPDTPLRCSGELESTVAGQIQVSVEQNDRGWTATLGGQKLSCASQSTGGTPSITSGLRRISIDSITTNNAARGPGMAAAIIGLGTTIIWFAVSLLVRRFDTTGPLLVAIGAGTGALLLPVDGAWFAETLRFIEVAGDRLPIVVGVIIGSGMLAIILSIHVARSRLSFLAVAPTIGFTILLAQHWGMSAGTGWLYSAAAGAVLGALVWVNVHARRIRLYNPISLALALSLMGCFEVMTRFSPVGPLWNAVDNQRGAGSMQTLIEQFQSLEAGVHTWYPAKGYPVALKAKQAEQRVACVGASSTGGAFQNDSLDQFYPARLAEGMPSTVEVVNQGVGGWTSFHIRIFLENHIDSLEADILTIYLGVNENLPTPVPFSDLYEMYKAGDLTQHSTALDSVRLYQGLRLMARGLRPGGGAGVSPQALEDNLQAIATLAQGRNMKVLLMSEGVRPDPRILWHYAKAMNTIADSNAHVHYLDTASILDEVGTGIFIDSNHLTDRGHRIVASAMQVELENLGWITKPSP
ncbi:MAG: SGNH/GDSL hydrolase family protein [Myxococcota bacterium]